MRHPRQAVSPFGLTRIFGVLVIGLALLPTTALAQGAIAGQVRDNTGGALPGATVEAASPALIEKVRAVVTDGEGRYSIVDLRPGVYTVTFMLEGFDRLVRSGIQLPSNFTATVDATLDVGSLAETVTVSGEAPIVDVRQSNTTQTLSRTLLDSLPLGRSVWEQGNLVAGVQMTGTDVGGTQYGSDLQLEAHGASPLHGASMIDGVGVDNIQRDSSDNLKYYAEVGNQEVVIESTGQSAEFAAGGVILNMIPKDGGNTFTGTAYAGGTDGRWQSDNFTQRLKDKGVSTLGRLDRIFDNSVTEGGPIVKDRLWFYASLRYWGRRTPTANSFYDDGSQYISQSAFLSPNPRLTWQVTPRNKLSAQIERSGPMTGPRMKTPAQYPAVILPGQRGNDPETATLTRGGRRPYGGWVTKWTSTVSNRLLLETGYSNTFVLDGGSDRQTGVGDERVRNTDLDLGTTWNSNWGFTAWRYLNEARGAMTFVTGTHKLKVGTQYKWGTSRINLEPPGSIDAVRFRSGVPDSALVGNFPVIQIPRLNYDVGIYAQDSWTMNRLTLNGGLRFEWMKASTDAQDAPAGRFVGERHFAEVPNLPKFGPNLAPRFGLAYDLFGNAKTALKFSVGQYYRRHTVTLAERLTPMAPVTVALPWNDRDLLGQNLPTNGDLIAQNNELDLTRLPVNFGERRLDTLDPNIKREYNVGTGLSLQHELVRNVSVTVGWYRRSFYNQYVDKNPVRGFNDYVPVQVVSPYNGEIITAYNLKSNALLPLVDAVVTNSTDNRQIYNGFELGFQARLPRGGMLLASSSTERTLAKACDVGSAAAIPDAAKGTPDDPNKQRFCDEFNLPSPYKVPFKTGFKLSGSYPLLFGVQASAILTSIPGRIAGNLVSPALPINWLITQATRYTAAQCAGQPCTAGDLVIPGLVESSLTIPLVPPGTVRLLEHQTQLNIGLRKNFRVGRLEYAAEFNLYNALNADTILNVVSNNFGTSSYDVPSTVLPGRTPRLALRMTW